jgi:hypothetical protein
MLYCPECGTEVGEPVIRSLDDTVNEMNDEGLRLKHALKEKEKELKKEKERSENYRLYLSKIQTQLDEIDRLYRVMR